MGTRNLTRTQRKELTLRIQLADRETLKVVSSTFDHYRHYYEGDVSFPFFSPFPDSETMLMRFPSRSPELQRDVFELQPILDSLPPSTLCTVYDLVVNGIGREKRELSRSSVIPELKEVEKDAKEVQKGCWLWEKVRPLLPPFSLCPHFVVS